MAAGESDEGSAFMSLTGLNRETRVRILVIEDNPGDARLIQECFRDDAEFLPVEFVFAETLREALTLLKEGRANFIMADLALPDSTGLDTFKAIQEAAPTLPIVVLSGNENEELAAEIVKLGAQDSLSKEFLGFELSAPLLRRTVRHAIERKQAHETLKAMQLQLIQADKLESLGRLAAGVAHEVRNPLASVQLGLEYLLDGIEPDDPKLPIVLKRMETGVERAKAILSGMLELAGDRGLQLEPVDANILIAKSLLLMEHEFKSKNIVVVREFAPEALMVRVDPAKIEQALINLILNAVQAMDRGELRTLVLRTCQGTMQGLERNPGARTMAHLRNGDKIAQIRIEDTGGGISRDDLERIWDPFFTTKPTGSGTGLGLAVVRKIVEIHHGLVEIENHESGARATLTLKAM